jgi:gamma-glutamyltranspeptidase/glutathione hydrolase
MKLKAYTRHVKIAMLLASSPHLLSEVVSQTNAAEIKTAEDTVTTDIRPEVGGLHGAVVSEHPLASQVGYDVLKTGGNAVATVVSIAAILSVVRPHKSNLGDGIFALFCKAKTEKSLGLVRQSVALV